MSFHYRHSMSSSKSHSDDGGVPEQTTDMPAFRRSEDAVPFRSETTDDQPATERRPPVAEPAPTPPAHVHQVAVPPPGARFRTPIIRNLEPAPAVAESDANDDVSTRRPMAPAGPRLLVDLLWYADEAPNRARAHPGWSSEVQVESDGEWITEGHADPTPADERDRRDVARALTVVTPSTAAEIAGCLAAAIDDRGLFVRPTLIVGGKLMMAFDPAELLGAVLSAVRPFGSADRKLKEAVEAAERAVDPTTRALESTLEALMTNVIKSFDAGSRGLGPDYLERAAERALLDEHRYASRVLFGARHHAAHVTPEDADPIVAYVPEAAATKLPLLRSFDVRLLVEPHSRQDPREAAALAFRVLAVARTTRI